MRAPTRKRAILSFGLRARRHARSASIGNLSLLHAVGGSRSRNPITRSAISESAVAVANISSVTC
jgi:hypothetical protein